jgi:uncharacterized protein (DUF1684 family)
MDAPAMLDLLEWKRRVASLYAEVRAAPDPAAAWEGWRAARDEIFRTNPQSPVPPEARAAYAPVPYFPYDPVYRVLAEIEAAAPEPRQVASSGDETIAFERIALARFALADGEHALELYWLTAYGAGLFVPFRDSTSGRETYGGGRYLLDTVKGSDLGTVEGRLVLDFNFAYNPSCSYDPRWICPLSPPANRLPVAIAAGERMPH